ncbi:MAG: EAL domain-containing protein [Pseudomonadota bacterium]
MKDFPFQPQLKAIFGSTYTIFFASAVISWPIMAELEAFEAFYEFSRAHEDWDIDEFALLGLNLIIALLLSVWHKSRTLKRLSIENEQERERADRNASHDALTGLFNRRALTEHLTAIHETLTDASPACLAMIDLDRFKPVNDLRGHAVGDSVLSSFSERLQAAIGSSGKVGRIGGDEFAVVYDHTLSTSEVERTARRVVHLMSEPFRFDAYEVSISCSIGLVVWTSDLTVLEAMRRADAALYKAKSEGRAQFAWYDAELDKKSSERASLEADLRQAILDEQIVPWFQPIVDIETRELSGFEVLARWNHPALGVIPPIEFIEIAEDCGLIDAMGQSLLIQACQTARDWPETLLISVNVSPMQFAQDQFVEGIRAVLAECDFDPQRLMLEVTESSVFVDFEAAGQKLNDLKELGVAVALDDFGTGYSSLATLRNLPFDRVKIDRSFISSIEAQPKNQKIVSVIMELAHGLGLDVTVEGIETRKELEYLETRSDAHAQGYLFAEPLPLADIQWRLETAWAGGLIDLDENTSADDEDAKTG